MNPNVIITCALTGAGDTAGKSPHVPVTPTQIAAAAVEAAKAASAAEQRAAAAAEAQKEAEQAKTGDPARGTDSFDKKRLAKERKQVRSAPRRAGLWRGTRRRGGGGRNGHGA